MRVNCPKCGLSGQMDDARIPGHGGAPDLPPLVRLKTGGSPSPLPQCPGCRHEHKQGRLRRRLLEQGVAELGEKNMDNN